MAEELQDQIQRVAQVRQSLEIAKNALAVQRAAFEINNKPLFDGVTACTDTVAQEEAKLRQMTLAAYVATGDKKPCPGVGIRELINLVYEPGIALNWAKEHRIALKLDVTAFERMCRTTSELRPGFVGVEKEYQATISPDLTPFVQAPG